MSLSLAQTGRLLTFGPSWHLPAQPPAPAPAAPVTPAGGPWSEPGSAAPPLARSAWEEETEQEMMPEVRIKEKN